MKGLVTILLYLSLLIGCAPQSTPQSPTDTAREYVDEWESMGASLPADQVSFFADNFSSLSGVLTDALDDPNERMRVRAAYVIGELGPVAASLEGDLTHSLQSETSRVVRLYLYQAIGSIEADKPDTLQLLREKLTELPENANASGPVLDETYTTPDERIYLASTLYVLDSDPQAKKSYFAEVAQWLSPPGDNLSQSEVDAYWEHRWCAVNAVEDMKGAREAIPLLQAMLTETPTKPWVSANVARAIESLEEGEDSEKR